MREKQIAEQIESAVGATRKQFDIQKQLALKYYKLWRGSVKATRSQGIEKKTKGLVNMLI